MPSITFNAFSFLQKELNNKNIECVNAVIEVNPGLTARAFLFQMGINERQAVSVLINGKVTSLDTVIEAGDRVAFVPNFTAGPDKRLKGLEDIKKVIHAQKAYI